VPALLVHGADDLVIPPGHGRWLAAHIVGAAYREIKGAGHISVLPSAGDSPLEWLADNAR
jgi:pimeloyl-ACP methyl ester carboxylesterase